MTSITSSATARKLQSSEGQAILDGFAGLLRRHLAAVDVEVGRKQSPELDELNSQLTQARELYALAADEVLNDIFVLERYVLMFREYGLLWHQIANSKFSESWNILQNVFNQIRVIRRFSQINLNVFEDQLCALETLYPYNIFFSMGAVVEIFECSICGEDIDSFKCNHRRGELYRGEMAIAIARNIMQLDHLAIVENPMDKRCVVTYDNDTPHFSAVRYLADLLTSRKIKVLGFGGAVWGKRIVPNEKHRTMGRNDRCYCDSGKKYKKCCIGKAHLEQDHVQILPGPSLLTCAVA